MKPHGRSLNKRAHSGHALQASLVLGQRRRHDIAAESLGALAAMPRPLSGQLPSQTRGCGMGKSIKEESKLVSSRACGKRTQDWSLRVAAAKPSTLGRPNPVRKELKSSRDFCLTKWDRR